MPIQTNCQAHSEPRALCESTRSTFLVADDDEVLRERLAKALSVRGFEVWTAGCAEAAIAQAERETPEYALIDMYLQSASGVEVARKLFELDATTRAVIFSYVGSVRPALADTRWRPLSYLTKPADVEEILAAFGQTGPAANTAALAGYVPLLGAVEQQVLDRVMHTCGGDIERAARLLGIHRRALQRRLVSSTGP